MMDECFFLTGYLLKVENGLELGDRGSMTTKFANDAKIR